MTNELVFKNHENGFKVAKILLDEGNVVMLSYEEEFLILNWEWCESGYADRNDVIFMQKWKLEEYEDEVVEAVLKDIAIDIKGGRSIEEILGNRLK